MTISPVCLWCGRPFSARRGGSPKRFCSAAHRTVFWSTLRRWAEHAVAAGAFTVADIRSGAPAACTLLPGDNWPAPISVPHKPAPVAPPERPGEAEELLDELLTALIDLPGDTWPDLAAALPDELFARIDRYLETPLD